MDERKPDLGHELLKRFDALLEALRPRTRLPVWYSPLYRLPISSLEAQRGLEPRRADYVLWFLGDKRIVRPEDVRSPERVTYEQMARTHTRQWLESLTHAATLARIFATDPSEVRVDELLTNVRLGCGATLAAAREALSSHGPTMNLHGGFHHAGPDRGGGLCALNDVAIAIAVLRDEGFDGQVVVLDFDAHPPDGSALCLKSDARTWLGSISGSDWGPLPGVDETVLPVGSGDAKYLAALEALLGRAPRAALAFVIAGGDVLGGDKFGQLALSLDGTRLRDLRVAASLGATPSVWLPGGGYHADAWKVLAGSALALTRGSRRPVPRRYDPLTSRFQDIADHLTPAALRGTFSEITDEDLEVSLGVRRGKTRLLEYYTTEGVEYALFQYGVFDFCRRLGYDHFRVELGTASNGGDVVKIWAKAPADRDGHEHLLVDTVLERMRVDGSDVLYVHWLTLRNPRAKFSDERPRLPGQDVPGLGIAREMIELFRRIAARLHLAGVAYRPAWLHTAWPARHRFEFVDPARQGRFEALARDLGKLPLLEASMALSGGRVRMNGEPYQWEPDPLVLFADGDDDQRPSDRLQRMDPTRAERVRAERERVHFTVVDEPARTGLPPATSGA